MPDARLKRNKKVEVAFNEDRVTAMADGLTRVAQAEQMHSLGVERCFGRVEIFRPPAAKKAPAEGDDPPLRVADGKHQTIAKTVVKSARFLQRHQTAAFDLGC